MRKSILVFSFISVFILSATSQDKKRVDSLGKKVELLYSLGNYQEALKNCRLYLQAVQQDLPENHLELGEAYGSIGLMLKKLNKFDSAAWYYDLAQSFFEKNNYTKTDGYSDLFINRATLMSTLGKYDSAIIHLNKGKEVCASMDGCKSSQRMLTILNNQANIYLLQNNNREAELVILDALKVAKVLGQENQMVGWILKNTLALCYFNLQQYNEATELLIEVVPFFDKYFGATNPTRITAKSNLFLSYFMLGERAKFEPIGNELYSKIEPLKDKTPYYQFLGNYSNMLFETGRMQEADKVLNSFIDDLGKLLGENHPEYRFIKNGQAILYGRLGQYEKAYSIYTNELLNKPPTGNYNKHKETFIYNNFIACLGWMDSLGKVIEIGEQALRRFGTDSSENTRLILGGICVSIEAAYLRKLDFKNALAYNDSAAAYIGKATSPQMIGRLKNRAFSLAGEKKFTESLAALKEALALINKMGLTNGEWHRGIVADMNAFYTETGDISSAAKSAKDVLTIFQQQLNDMLDYLSPTEREYLVHNTLTDLNQIIDFYLYANKKLPGKYTDDFLNSLFFRENILLKTQTATKKAVLQSNDSVLIAKYQRLQDLKTNWIYQLQVSYEKRKNTDQIKKEIQQLEKEIFPTLKNVKEKTPEWRSITTNLAANEAYIHYYQAGQFENDATGFSISNRECYAIIIKRNAEPVIVEVDPQKKILAFFQSNAQKSRFEVSQLYDHVDSSSGALSLYHLIWEPLEKHLKNIDRIYLRTNGNINRISFASIQLPDKRYLIDKYFFRRLIVVTDSSFKWNTRPGTVKNMLLVGDVDFDTKKAGQQRSAEGFEWAALPSSREEINSINDILAPKNYLTVLLTDSIATEDAVSNAINSHQPGIFHAATHGFFNTKAASKNYSAQLTDQGIFAHSDISYLQSGIVLAGANKYDKKMLAGEDGILNAYEIQGLDFQKTDLVVMSACETAWGNIDRQEGVYGLQRAFKIAGAKYQVLSLWQVPDKETKELMTLFYEQLSLDKTYEESFHYAQSEMRKKYNPYYWAGFVLMK